MGIGWGLALMCLGLHLASGADSDPAEFAAWMGSADGAAFVTRASRGWADASVAAGTDETQARGAQDRVTAFYTGG